MNRIIKRDFPQDFVWGTATASYQVEGGAAEDGKGPSIWDEFEKKPGAIADNASGTVTSNQYHKWHEDVLMMKENGMNAYRFSIAWPRVMPEGRGAVNQKGLDYYKRLCDTLKENGIEPYVTLYHWDLPQALQRDIGGWEARDTAFYMGEYAEIVAKALGTSCSHYFTVNEFLGCIDQGYANGISAPGLKLPAARRNQARHHMLLAHGLSLQALRQYAPHAKVGIAENPTFFMPLIDTPENVDLAKKVFREKNAHFLTAIMEGKYIDSYLEAEKENAPKVQEGDFKLISAPMDALGLNIYYGHFVRPAADKPEGYEIHVEYPDDGDVLFQPASMYWGCRMVSELWAPKEILISENGIGEYNVRPNAQGEVNDFKRIKYMREYLGSLARVLREGMPVKGYFHWSLVDNLEWSCGFRPRFGLCFVNYQDSTRIPKLSWKWYGQLARTGILP